MAQTGQQPWYQPPTTASPVPRTAIGGTAQRKTGNFAMPQSQVYSTSCLGAKRLSAGRYRWRHYRVLRKLAEVLELRMMEAAKTAESQTAFQGKEDKHSALAAGYQEAGWSTVHSAPPEGCGSGGGKAEEGIQGLGRRG